MGLADFISRQPNQKAKFTNNYDEEFLVALFTRISDAIATIYINSKQHSTLMQQVTHTAHALQVLSK